MDVTKYLALLDQFLTNDIIGSCALAKTIHVMIDRNTKIDVICSIISIISLSFLLYNYQILSVILLYNST